MAGLATTSTSMALLSALILLAAAARHSSAFRPTALPAPSLTTTGARHRRGATVTAPRRVRFGIVVSAAAEDAAAEGGEEGAVAEEEKEMEEEAQQEEEESEEMKAIKSEIAQLERTLNSKRLEAGRLEEEADDLSEGGYLRKCAEMDNVRKRRDAAFANDKFVARALVVQKFLPVYDGLNELADRFASNEFAKQYAALKGDFKSKFNTLDVEEYGGDDGDVYVGKRVDSLRFATVGEEFSDDIPKGAVVRVVGTGMEVRGNVIRLAECVLSRGSEAEYKRAQEAKAKAEAEAEAEAAAAAAATAEAEADDEEESEEGGKDE